jgi:uncharacterized protein with PQ loop repeat
MNITTDELSEIIGWSGGAIFTVAQIIQIIHTFIVKNTTDISYGLQVLWLIGNFMYTTFGYTSESMSMFVYNALTSGTTIIQIMQKVYFDNYYKPKKNLLLKETV